MYYQLEGAEYCTGCIERMNENGELSDKELQRLNNDTHSSGGLVYTSEIDVPSIGFCGTGGSCVNSIPGHAHTAHNKPIGDIIYDPTFISLNETPISDISHEILGKTEEWVEYQINLDLGNMSYLTANLVVWNDGDIDLNSSIGIESKVIGHDLSCYALSMSYELENTIENYAEEQSLN